jgi:peptide/nickel transport system substrate-binding protein
MPSLTFSLETTLGSLFVRLAALASLLLTTACAATPSAGPQAPGSGGNTAGAPTTQNRAPRTLTFIARGEPENLSEGAAVGTSSSTTFRFFNASLSLRNGQGVPGPQLATALPSLNTDTWQVLSDGRMQTSYRLKPNLTWHDGKPLTAEDFVFAWTVAKTPSLGAAGDLPQSLMERVEATDPSTFVVHWSALFPDADLMEGFQPLPKHLLGPLYEDLRPDAWVSMPFWTRDYVGLGAYKIDNWSPGEAIEAAAFDGFVFGKPRIDRLRIIFMQDPNAVAANLLSESAQLVADITIRTQTGVLLKREWEPRKGGSVYFTPAQIRFTYFQLRPEYANPREIADLRVRKAVAHSIDKVALADVLHEGEGIPADALVRRSAPEYSEIDRAATKYSHDPRLAQQLLEEAGLTRGADGFYASPNGPFTPDWKATAGGDTDLQLGILVDGLRRIGVDARQSVLPRPFSNETRVTFPAMFNWSTTNQPEGWLLNYASSRIAGPENRWTGSNFGAWSHPEYDRLAGTFATTLDRNQRSQLMIQMARLLTEQIPTIPLYYNLDVVAHTAALKNLQVVPDGSIGFNVHEWELN